jgi:hypothetical protein
MGILTLDRLAAGMKLAADVKDRTGRVILAAGSEVNEKHLRIFRMWGISQADVQGMEQHPATMAPPAADADILQEAELRVRELFRHAERSHPAVEELYRLSCQRLVTTLMGEDHGRESA